MSSADAVASDSDWSACSDEALIQRLWRDGDRLPRGVIDELARRERLIPRLGALIREDGAWDHLQPPECWAPLHATFALHASGKLEAVPHLIEAIRRADEVVLDWVIDAAGALFNRIGPVGFPAVRAAWQDPAPEGIFVRWHLLDAMAALSLGRPELERVVIEDAARAVANDRDPEIVLAAQEVLAGFHALGRTAEVLEALGAGPAPSWLTWTADHEPFPSARLEPLAFYDPEAIARRQERWKQQELEEALGAEEEDDDDWPIDDDDDGLFDRDGDLEPDSSPPAEPGMPVVRTEPKVGRNDPCPCGSGRKHKKCCLE